MGFVSSKEQNILRNLGEGLVLRRITGADTDALVVFNARVHGNLEKEVPEEGVGIWTQDLIERPHPTFDIDDFTVVEDTKTREIVSTLTLISQTWTYGGIPFGVGRPEMVGTHPDYRNCGLVRAQFEVVHQRSADRGEKMQVITGIPYYYRQFGYEMALALGGGRLGYLPQVPKLKDGEDEPYFVRPAKESDLTFIAQLYRQASKRYLVNCIRDEAIWNYELSGKSERSIARSELRLIETPNGEPVGFLAHPPLNWGPTLVVHVYELKPGVSWSAVTPSVIRYVNATGEAYAEGEDKKEFEAFGFWLGTEHPVYGVISDRLPRVRKPYAFYVRVPDLPDFINHVAPVLEERLASSPMVGHTGELKITFYRDGLQLVFEEGRLAEVEGWKPTPHGQSGEAAFPELTFLQLLFGYRSFEEIDYAFVDCWASSDEVRALLNILFPKQVSNVWAVA